MNLTDKQKLICEQIINVFETGSTQGNYSAISIFHDGPNGIRQVTYGRSQTTEYGNLEELIEMYVGRNGIDSEQLQPYLPKIGVTQLVDDHEFQQLLKDAGKNDPVMRSVQDVFFDKRYFQPAMNWADDNGFTLALSALVIYDSFIHSGSILPFLRKRFAAVPPNKGGDEKTWISQYVDARHQWLATASNPELHPTVYRTQCFKDEIARNNWDLSKLPINANGIHVSGV
ncbi:chitosanase [Methylobacter tundripaludum]|uniref:Chitosanase n=1 Tax=Methylobacter tundripaludum TaxID=173365 RepID=A0A2S6H8W8_9GAMM|nr:chitosanase [Methylobacter tundripaludum]PPK73942.1 chitosanase [Methylobacter tundripaludum]